MPISRPVRVSLHVWVSTDAGRSRDTAFTAATTVTTAATTAAKAAIYSCIQSRVATVYRCTNPGAKMVAAGRSRHAAATAIAVAAGNTFCTADTITKTACAIE